MHTCRGELVKAAHSNSPCPPEPVLVRLLERHRRLKSSKALQKSFRVEL